MPAEVELSGPTVLLGRDRGAATHGQGRPPGALGGLRARRGGLDALGRGGAGRRRTTVQRAEEVRGGHHRLVAKGDVELGLCGHRLLEVGEAVDDTNARVHRRHREFFTYHDPPLELLGVQRGHAHGDAVALYGLWHDLLKHLQAPDLLPLAGLAQGRHHDCLLRLDGSGQHRAREHRALAFDREGVVEGEHERAGRVPPWQLQLGLQHIHQALDADWRGPVLRAGRHAGEGQVAAELCCGKRDLQLLDDGLQRLLALGLGDHVDLVEDDHQLVRQDLRHHQALGGLRLDPLVGIDDERAQVDDLRAADDRPDQRGVPRAVHQAELQHAVAFRLELLGRVARERREAQVQRDSTLLRLRMLVQGRSRRHRGQRPAQRSLPAIDVAQDADVHIDRFATGLWLLIPHARGP
mmetsp:Transcript_88313/g.270263  ORF Transcript_88313/g.270263 Transcript_88313/m.270263 type:complete len:409 (+) Transcript_88313:891-2117(+)